MNEKERKMYEDIKSRLSLLYIKEISTQEQYDAIKALGNDIDDLRYDMMVNHMNYSEIKEFLELKQYLDLHDQLLNGYLAKILDANIPNDIRICMEMLDRMNGYAIGSHICGMNNKIMSKPEELADSILSKGLISARREGGGIAEDVHILGSENVLEKLKNMLERFYTQVIQYNTGGVVVAIPQTLLNSEGEEVFVGKFPEDLAFGNKDDDRIRLLPLNVFVRKIGYLPKEFIVGVVSKNQDGSISFHKNDKFISLLSYEEQIDLYNKFVEQGLSVNLFQNGRYK